MEVRGLFATPNNEADINIRKEIGDSEDRAVTAVCLQQHADTIAHARTAVTSLHDRISRLKRRFNIDTPEQLEAMRSRLLQLDHEGYVL